jgi:hypothetical protein
VPCARQDVRVNTSELDEHPLYGLFSQRGCDTFGAISNSRSLSYVGPQESVNVVPAQSGTLRLAIGRGRGRLDELHEALGGLNRRSLHL